MTCLKIIGNMTKSDSNYFYFLRLKRHYRQLFEVSYFFSFWCVFFEPNSRRLEKIYPNLSLIIWSHGLWKYNDAKMNFLSMFITLVSCWVTCGSLHELDSEDGENMSMCNRKHFGSIWADTKSSASNPDMLVCRYMNWKKFQCWFEEKVMTK